MWVASGLDSTVSRIDPFRGSVVATIPVGSGPVALAVAGGFVWVANQYSGTVSRIDPKRNAVVGTTSVGGAPTALAAAGGKLWVGVRPRAQHRGGTLVMLTSTPLSIDPAAETGVPPFQNLGLTSDGLVTYNHVSGPNGLQVVPDLAISLPTPTDGGMTYTFRLRPGIRYSDGRFVRASDFRRADRALLPPALARSRPSRRHRRCICMRGAEGDRVRSQPRGGHGRCLRHRDVPPQRPRSVTSSRTSRTAALPFRFRRAPRCGASGFTPIPGTGPYKVASADRHHIRYVRNPFFREWSHAAQPAGNPDEIVWRFGLSPAQQVRAIEQGRADWMADPVPGALLPRCSNALRESAPLVPDHRHRVSATQHTAAAPQRPARPPRRSTSRSTAG